MYEGFWRIKAQPSTHFTAWKVLEDKIASKGNLVKKGYVWKVVSVICVGRVRKPHLTSIVRTKSSGLSSLSVTSGWVWHW